MARSTCLGESVVRVQERKQVVTVSPPQRKMNCQGWGEEDAGMESDEGLNDSLF